MILKARQLGFTWLALHFAAITVLQKWIGCMKIYMIGRRINELHTKKSEFEEKLMMIERKVRKIDTTPLADPLAHWDELSNNEKHDVAMLRLNPIFCVNAKQCILKT